ncbi:MAG TPA: hypothetical protein VMW52_13820 [Phycisphaerae bacterium]|nr:hypothetical protein [Phycisphaerae bacterium]
MFCTNPVGDCQQQNPADLTPPLAGNPEPLRLALGAVDAARACGISVRSWRRADDVGLIPLAARVGRRKVWPVALLKTWLVMGCPSRSAPEWQAVLQRSRKGAAT